MGDTLVPIGSTVKRYSTAPCVTLPRGSNIVPMGDGGYVDPEFGKRLRALRGNEGQLGFGERVGVDGGVISRWETGARKPEMQYLLPLARALCVSVDYLLTGKGPKLPKGSLAGVLGARQWSPGTVAEACDWSHREVQDPGAKAWTKRLLALEEAIIAARAEYMQDAEEGMAMQPGKRTK